jgi:drug/metabolite transporter (DMT)-like permease
MPSWLILAVGAQFIAALVALLDKYIVTNERAIPKPFVYAFITCLMSGASIVVFFFSWVPIPLEGVHFPSLANVEFPSLIVVAFSFLAAYTFFSALTSMFSALKEADASDVVPVIGAVSALATFGFSYMFLGGTLSQNFLAGIILLAIGTALVSHFRFHYKTALLTLHAGLFFALHYVTFKGLLGVTSFDNALFWSRICFVGFALSMLLVPDWFERVTTQVKTTGKRAGLLVIANKILAGASAIMILKASELATQNEFPVIQALGGLQFVFILILGLVLGRRTPHEYGENSHMLRDIFHKAVFVSMIALGFFMLFV